MFIATSCRHVVGSVCGYNVYVDDILTSTWFSRVMQFLQLIYTLCVCGLVSVCKFHCSACVCTHFGCLYMVTSHVGLVGFNN